MGNPTLLWPQPVAADVRKKKKRRIKGSEEEVSLSPAGSAAQPKAACKTSAATGTRGRECRQPGGPRCLRGQVLVLAREKKKFFLQPASTDFSVLDHHRWSAYR